MTSPLVVRKKDSGKGWESTTRSATSSQWEALFAENRLSHLVDLFIRDMAPPIAEGSDHSRALEPGNIDLDNWVLPEQLCIHFKVSPVGCYRLEMQRLPYWKVSLHEGNGTDSALCLQCYNKRVGRERATGQMLKDFVLIMCMLFEFLLVLFKITVAMSRRLFGSHVV